MYSDYWIGYDDCNGNYVQADIDFTTNIIMHKIGHALGLEHTSDENHLMYGEDYIQTDFDTLGYTIPELLEWNYVGQKSLIEHIEQLETEYNELDTKFVSILDQFGFTVEQYERMPTVPRSLFVEIDPVITELNSKVDQMEPLIDELVCYPN